MRGPAGEEGRGLILRYQQGLKQDGIAVLVSQLCRWFGMSRRTVYYRSITSAPKVQESLASPIKHMIDAEPSCGYRTVAHLLGLHKNTVQRVFQLRAWQVHKRSVGHPPKTEALPSVAKTPGQRWATELCRVWAGRDGWQILALVVDCQTRGTAGMATVEKRPGHDHHRGTRAGPDRPLRVPGTGLETLPAEV